MLKKSLKQVFPSRLLWYTAIAGGSLFIGFYLYHTYRHDNYLQHHKRMAGVVKGHSTDSHHTSAATGNPAGENCSAVQIPSLRLHNIEQLIHDGGKPVLQQNFLFADSAFLKLFSFHLIEGDKRTALSGPNKVILTTSTARKYFGRNNPLGKTLLVGPHKTAFEVTGIMADCPFHSRIKFEMIASFASLSQPEQDQHS